KKHKSRRPKEKDTQNTKTVQAQDITSLKKRVKKLEKKGGSRTHKLKRLYKVGRSARIVFSDEASLGDQEDVFKQGRKIDNINKDTEITWVDETHGRHNDDIMFDVSDLAGEEVFVAEQGVPDSKKDDAVQVNTVATTVNTASTILVSASTITKDEITLAQALVELKSVKPKVTTATTATTKGILLQEPNEAIRLQAKFDEEVRLAREKYEANVALIKEWNDIQEKIDVDYQMAKQMQAEEQEELSIEEKSKLFVQLLEARKKHFAAKRAEEKRNIPPTRAQQRSVMLGDDLEQEKAKKQKVDKDKETAELQSLMKVIFDEEEVEVDAIPLATKPPSIVDWTILKEGKTSYY
ncbi:hypothetical protein Tco_0882421, partial [Tanacetum coccineum]